MPRPQCVNIQPSKYYPLISPSCTFFALYYKIMHKKSPNVLIFYLNPCSPSAFNTISKHCNQVDNNSFPISNSRPQTSYRVWSVMAFLSLPRQCQIAPQMRPQPLLSTCFRIHHSLIILSFDSIQSEQLTEILSKS
jgi:hypothetical protein